MAVCAVIPSIAKLQAHGIALKEPLLLAKTSHVPTQRKIYCTSCKVMPLSLGRAHNLIAPRLSMSNGIPKSRTLNRCYCLGALVSADGAISSDWVPIADQVLLLASMILTFIAGVIPTEKNLYNNSTIGSQDDVIPESSSSSGSEMTNDNEVYLQFAWDIVKGKLMDSLSATEVGLELRETFPEFEGKDTKCQSSLCAVADSPRIRLLWASFQWFNKEVSNISGNCVTKSTKEFSAVFTEIILNCNQNLCKAWLEEELRLVSRKPDKELPSMVVNKLGAYDNLIQIIRKSGKEGLYVELTYALKFGSSRNDGCYNYSLFAQHGVAILEDLLITLADGIASTYLELISVDSSLSNEINNLGLSLCTLSTRALQRLRNEVALNQWLHQNMSAIVSMYEDRFELCTLRSVPIEKSNTNEAENFSWWKQFSLMRSGAASPDLHFVVINQVSVPFKRTKELRALTGWRYYFSLFLELADIAMPFVRTVVAKVSDAISFFLVSLIGRSLGLIYSGIRQSLRWK
ncbi:uncharacterized protein [Henckelia pumila]|uniref:uncharacterized protein isoform X2 n=1 Tax=Henckelia pumila TaxID=405737 RepID=UPI003C6E2B93